MEVNTIQKRLFEQIILKSKNTGKNLAKDISKILNLSSNVVYDRISGKKLLNIEEVFTLAQGFHISLDELLYSNYTGFQLNTIQAQPKSFEDFLKSVYQNIGAITNDPSSEIYYSAIETPFFYYLLEPKLAVFKMYIWNRTIWQNSVSSHTNFNLLQLLNPEILQLIEENKNAYLKINSIEFWNTGMIDSTLDQIRYALNSDLINVEIAEMLFHCQERILDKMEDFAANEKKENQGKSSIYHSELVPTPALIVVSSPNVNLIYNIYDSPNYMISSAPKMFDYTIQMFDKMRKGALPLAEDRQRSRFFKYLRKKLDSAKASLQLL